MDVAPLTAAEHIIEAILPDAKTRQRLDLDEQVPCIVMRRRTWSGAAVASSAQLVYPGSRYRLGGRFVPKHKPVLTR
jgi:GntR family histidine utilization transcriptional repressor